MNYPPNPPQRLTGHFRRELCVYSQGGDCPQCTFSAGNQRNQPSRKLALDSIFEVFTLTGCKNLASDIRNVLLAVCEEAARTLCGTINRNDDRAVTE